MAKYKALKNLIVGEGEKGSHKHVKAGEVFECSEDFADEHLVPHGHAEETSEEVTVKAKAADKKKAKAEEKSKSKKDKE